MSDFFSSLAGRLEGTVPVIRPRLPSLFENAPGPATSARDAEPSLVVEDVEREASASPRRRERPAMPAEPPRPEETEERPAERPRRKQAKRGDVREEGAGAAERPAPVPLQSRNPVRRRDEAPAPAAETLRDAPRPAAVEPIRARSLPLEQPRLPQTIVQRSVVERREEIHRIAPAAAAVPPPGAARSEPLQHLTPTPPPFALSPQPALPQGVRQDVREQIKPETRRDVQEPTIHVSIGRIDIRAETEASQRRKPSEASPVMSLDEYLRSRVR